MITDKGWLDESYILQTCISFVYLSSSKGRGTLSVIYVEICFLVIFEISSKEHDCHHYFFLGGRGGYFNLFCFANNDIWEHLIYKTWFITEIQM